MTKITFATLPCKGTIRIRYCLLLDGRHDIGQKLSTEGVARGLAEAQNHA